MAKRSGSGGGGGGGGGGEPKKQSILLSFMGEAAEFGAGVIAGQAASSILGSVITGGMAALKEKIFGEMFGTRGRGESAKDDEVTAAKKKFRDRVHENSGKDEKLASLAEEYMANMVSIQSSNRPDKDQSLQRERERYRLVVCEYLLSLTKRGLQETLSKLDAANRERFRRWYSLRQIPLTGNMTSAQIAETIALNAGRLTDQQRNLISIQKDHINSPEMLKEMLDFSEDATIRFDFLMDALPKITITEHLGGALEAIVTGHGGEHPVVQSIQQGLKANAASRDAERVAKAAHWTNRNKLMGR